MKKIYFLFICLFSIFYPTIYASGGLTHMYIARQTIDRLPNPTLRAILLNHLDAYLVGAYYPDSGYIEGSHYGEISHWDPFIYAFADHIKEKYSKPEIQNPKLVAFLFGCAVHRVSDEISHFIFYAVIKDKDFNGSYSKAHTFGDIGIDLLLNIDQNQWITHPKTWWVPIRDLLQVYQRMGAGPFSELEILTGNAAISVAGYFERLIALPAYPYLRLRMPWTALHYQNYPQGGIDNDVNQVVAYQIKLWNRLTGKKQSTSISPRLLYSPTIKQEINKNPLFHLIAQAINLGTVKIETTHYADGSVEFPQPTVVNEVAFKNLGKELAALLKE